LSSPDKPTYPEDRRRCPGCGVAIDWDQKSVMVRGDRPVLVLLVETFGGWVAEVHRCPHATPDRIVALFAGQPGLFDQDAQP